MATAAVAFYWYSILVGEWPHSSALVGGVGVGALSLLLVLPRGRRPAMDVEMPTQSVMFPLIIVDSDRRSRWQFGIRSLLVLTTLVALITAVARRDGVSPSS